MFSYIWTFHTEWLFTHIHVSTCFIGALVPEPIKALNTDTTKYVYIALMFIYTCLYLQTKAIKLAVSAYKTVVSNSFENFS